MARDGLRYRLRIGQGEATCDARNATAAFSFSKPAAMAAPPIFEGLCRMPIATFKSSGMIRIEPVTLGNQYFARLFTGEQNSRLFTAVRDQLFRIFSV
jgi:hypothetical protein